MQKASPDRPASRQSSGPILSVVLVNYNSWPDLVRLVPALSAAPEVADGRCEILVVDNASVGPIPDALSPPPFGVRLVLRPENGGFAAGVNAGWRASRGRWLLLLNPDVIAGADLPGRVLERIAHHEEQPAAAPGIVGFGLRDPDGSRQPSVGVEPSLFRSLRGLFIPRRRRKYQTASRHVAGAVPWVTGACALVDTRVLEALGGMDEEFFLYYEEVALCRSARDLGRRVEYDPGIEVVHLRPLQNRPITPALRVITRQSKLLYFRKYLPGWQFQMLAWIVAVEARVRGLVATLQGKGSEKRAWRAVDDLARRMRRGAAISGTEVRDLAAAVAGCPAAEPQGQVQPPRAIRGPRLARRAGLGPRV